jgi:hypothetical protein
MLCPWQILMVSITAAGMEEIFANGVWAEAVLHINNPIKNKNTPIWLFLNFKKICNVNKSIILINF